MCGRYVRKDTAKTVYSYFEINDIRIEWTPCFNVPPTSKIPVVRESSGTRELVEMLWGLRPAWVQGGNKLPLMHNAKMETVARLPSFREAFKWRRCIVPASGYFEWKAGPPKQPYYFERSDGKPLAFAAIWENHPEAADTVSILTTSANAKIGKIHHRMPVLLTADVWSKWFRSEPLSEDDSEKILSAPSDVDVCFWPVGKAVGNVRNDSPDLIRPRDSSDPDGTLGLFGPSAFE